MSDPSTSKPSTCFYEFGPFCLDASKHLLLRDGRPVSLTPKALEILLALVENGGRVLGKDAMLQKIWPDTLVEENNLTVNISALRKALGESPAEHRYIVTVPGQGYRFVAEIRELPGKSADLFLERTKAQIVIEEEEDGPNSEKSELAKSPARSLIWSRSGPSRALTFALVVGVIALTATAAILYRQRVETGGAESAPIRSVAVLPLKNLSDDPSNEYFSDGMTESLISALSRIEGLKVISRGSVVRFKGKETDPAEVGRQLGVEAVLEGNVRKSTDSLRVAVRLVSVKDGRVLWARDTHERALGDIFALQDDIARSVAAGLRLELAPEGEQRLTKRYTDNVEAYQLYLKGRYHVFELSTPDPVKTGMEYFKKAIEIDPNYALAHAGLADAYYGLSNAILPPGEAMPKARAAAMKALELDDTLAEAHISLGLVKLFYDWDFAWAEREFERAVELNPNDPVARNWYSWHLLFTGRSDEALAEMRRAEKLDPLSLKMKKDLGRVLYYARQHDQAIEQYKKALELNANDSQTHWFLGVTYVVKGRVSEALAEFQKAMALDDDRFRLPWLGCAYAMSGKRGEARKVIDEMESNQGYVAGYSIALVYIALGEKDAAFRLLEKDYQERNEVLVWARVDPLLDDLRSDPRFVDLMRRVGLAQ
ncbi:MAG: tetratricopeptide repeat protein [Pyrinomonadaceae bacterium]